MHAGDGLLGDEEMGALAGRPPASSASASFRAAMRAANSAYTGRPSGAGTCGSCAASSSLRICVPLCPLVPACIPAVPRNALSFYIPTCPQPLQL